jgi:hypothetical protein
MKTFQSIYKNGAWDKPLNNGINPQLCLLFGSRFTIESNMDIVDKIKSIYPNTTVVTASSAGNIIGEQILDDVIILTAVEFKKTKLKFESFVFGNENEFDLGSKLANHFKQPELVNLLVFSTIGINVGKLLNGINAVYQGSIPVSGGVAGDDSRFEKTLVGLDNNFNSNHIVGIGFYGTHLKLGYGSKGGWEKFGPMRKITKAKDNILYEIDDKPVLDLYESYLGDKAKELPASGLLFPFTIYDAKATEPIVRSIQNIDKEQKSLILFGDVNVGDSIQLMRANFTRLIDGAANSASETFLKNAEKPELSILISCVARRLVLGQMTEEELVESKKILGSQSAICGFYSYSEISPLVNDNACQIHNQTMTITTFTED